MWTSLVAPAVVLLQCQEHVMSRLVHTWVSSAAEKKWSNPPWGQDDAQAAFDVSLAGIEVLGKLTPLLYSACRCCGHQDVCTLRLVQLRQESEQLAPWHLESSESTHGAPPLGIADADHAGGIPECCTASML